MLYHIEKQEYSSKLILSALISALIQARLQPKNISLMRSLARRAH